MDRFRTMESFVRVVRAGSFTIAASQLGLSRALVSRHVSELESRLGARLLNRSTRSLNLTEEGTAYLEFCERVFRDIESNERAILRTRQEPVGMLKLMAPKSFGAMHLSDAVIAFAKLQPRLRVLLTLEKSEVLFEEVMSTDKKKMIDVAAAYTTTAQRYVEQAWQLSKQLKHQETRPLHLLAVLLSAPQTRTALARLGVAGKTLVEKISRSLNKIPAYNQGNIIMSVDFKKVLLTAYYEAYQSRQVRVDIPQLLVALVKIDEISREIFYDLETVAKYAEDYGGKNKKEVRKNG